MGKDLKGKECGKGICQRKDGLYLAQFVDKAGKRLDKCFQKLPEARNWLEEARVLDRQGGQRAEPHEENFALPDMTVDAWFDLGLHRLRKEDTHSKQDFGVPAQADRVESRAAQNSYQLPHNPTHEQSI